MIEKNGSFMLRFLLLKQMHIHAAILTFHISVPSFQMLGIFVFRCLMNIWGILGLCSCILSLCQVKSYLLLHAKQHNCALSYRIREHNMNISVYYIDLLWRLSLRS